MRALADRKLSRGIELIFEKLEERIVLDGDIIWDPNPDPTGTRHGTDTDGWDHYWYMDSSDQEYYFRFDDNGQWWIDSDNHYSGPGDTWTTFGDPDADSTFVYDGRLHDMEDGYEFIFRFSVEGSWNSSMGYGYWRYENAGTEYLCAYGYDVGDWWWDPDGGSWTSNAIRFVYSGASDDFIYDGKRHDSEYGTDYIFFGSWGLWRFDETNQFALDYEQSVWRWYNGNEWYQLGHYAYADYEKTGELIFNGEWHSLYREFDSTAGSSIVVDYMYANGCHYWISSVTGAFMFDTASGMWSYDAADNPQNPVWVEFDAFGFQDDADADFVFDGNEYEDSMGRSFQMDEGHVLYWDSGTTKHGLKDFRYDLDTGQWQFTEFNNIPSTPCWLWLDVESPLSTPEFIYDGSRYDLPNGLEYRYTPEAGYWIHHGPSGPENYVYEHATGQWYREGQPFGDPHEFGPYPSFLLDSGTDEPQGNANGAQNDFLPEHGDILMWMYFNALLAAPWYMYGSIAAFLPDYFEYRHADSTDYWTRAEFSGQDVPVFVNKTGQWHFDDMLFGDRHEFSL